MTLLLLKTVLKLTGKGEGKEKYHFPTPINFRWNYGQRKKVRIMARRADDETEGHWGSFMANILFINSADIDETHFVSQTDAGACAGLGVGAEVRCSLDCGGADSRLGVMPQSDVCLVQGSRGAEGVYKRGLPHPRTVCSELVFNGGEEVVRQRHARWSEESIGFIRIEG